jgi:hypothetical protein
MLELKIYVPYFISNETIIQYQSSLKKATTPKKLSIMDILEAHFLEKKTNSRLFFKVDLTHEIDNNNFKLSIEEPNSSFAKSLVNKTLKKRKTLESNEMEEIAETNSLLEMEKNNSIHEEKEESKLSDTSYIVS